MELQVTWKGSRAKMGQSDSETNPTNHGAA